MGLQDIVEPSFNRKIGTRVEPFPYPFFFLAGDLLHFIGTGLGQLNQIGMIILVHSLIKADVYDRIDIVVVLVFHHDVPTVRRDLGFFQPRFCLGQDYSVNPVFCAVMVNNVTGAEFTQGDCPGPGNIFTGSFRIFKEDPDWKPCKTIARKQSFGCKVSIWIKLRLIVLPGTH